jgi:hypothetical protein
MNTTKTEVRSEIERYLDVYSNEQLELIHNVIKTFAGSNLNKKSLMQLVLTEDEIRKCDTALPQPLVNAVQELLPSFDTFDYCYNYNEKSFGEMYSIPEAIVNKLAKVLNNNNFEN